MGGVFVVETLSVMLQVAWFKYTKKRYGEGRRIFRMAPLHHHFEVSGWKETQVVVRFWIISMIDRKSVVEGKRVSVRVDLTGRRITKNKKETTMNRSYNIKTTHTKQT